MLRTLLAIVMILRLLVPPGVCLCHLFAPESEAHSDHDHHAPGCPASKMAGTLWIKKSENPHVSLASTLVGVLSEVDRSTSPFPLVSPEPAAAFADPHLYLTLCTLRI